MNCQRFGSALASMLMIGASYHLAARGQVTTSQYDNARTGATTVERVLTPANVNGARFGKLFTLSVDGDVYAQPLYLPRVNVPGQGTHDIVYVATEHDSVYAFDAAGRSGQPLWHVSLLNRNDAPVSSSDVRCPFIAPEIGITPTPVIDVATGTMYVLARTKEEALGIPLFPRYIQRLHALDVATGAEKFGGPVEIQASVKGTGAGSAHGVVAFDPVKQLPRAGLALAGGHVYLTWGSSCDVKPYHGWVMAYDARSLKQTAVLNTSPDGNESGIWQSDMAPAVAADGSVYVATGNGTFNAAARSYGDSVLKLQLRGGALTVADVFTPSNEGLLNSRDLDLGSGGPILIPTAAGTLLAIAGKQGPLHVVDSDKLSGEPLQVLPLGPGVYSTPAYWNGHVFVLASRDMLRDFAVAGARLSDRPVASGTVQFDNPGAGPVVSANGTRDGIVWLIETKVWNAYASTKASVLHAYDAANVARELYNSEQNGERDRAGVTVRFTLPMVANGRVYVGAKREVDVYGLLPSSH
jgi:hypothetical protein